MELKLSKNDLRWAHWRNIPPEKMPKTVLFDLQARLEQLKGLSAGNRPQISLSKFKINISMSQEEAHFWLETYAKYGEKWNIGVNDLLTYVDRPASEYHGNLTLKDVQTILGNPQPYYFNYDVVIPLFRLLNPTDFVTSLIELEYRTALIEAIRLQIMPYLSDETRDLYRDAVRHQLDHPILLAFAGLLGGLDAEIEHYFKQFDSSPATAHYARYYDHQYYAVFGLNSPEKVKHYVKERKLVFYEKKTLIAWIAHTELSGLDVVAKSVAARYNKSGKKSAFSIFKKIQSEEAVPNVLELWADPHLTADALDWLTKNPEIVASTLAPTVFENTKQSKLALKYLRRMVSIGQVEYLEAVLPNLDADLRQRFKDEVIEFYVSDVPEFDETNTPDWLSEAMSKQGKSKAGIQWVDILSLPPLTVAGFRLNIEQVQHVLIALRKNNTEFLDQICKHVTQQERDDFAWALYQGWEDVGAPSKGKWTFDRLGTLGGDSIVLKLVPFLKKWPVSESKHKRASDGIKVLQEVGTDTALMQINNLAQKIRYKSVKRTAKQAMENIASARGLTQSELEDRIIPDAGLDEDGTRNFDFGPRQFTFLLTSDMKPAIRDEKGKIRKNLPRPNKKDNEQLSAQANADWKLIKKQVREVAKLQAERLETAMISQRRWQFSEFKQFYVDHPLMIHIIRLLLWGAYDNNGELLYSFRVDEERQIVNMDDEPLETSEIALVGVLHIMEIEEDDRKEWGDVLSDYEIIAPFQQLSSKVSTLDPDEVDQKLITRFEPYKVEPVVMVSILEKSGWMRGQAQDAGVYYSHAKYYPFGDVTAVVRYYGVPMGYWDYDEQGIDQCFFLEGKHAPEGYREYKEEQMMTLSDVSPIVLSETLRTLHAIAGKAK